MQISKAPIKPSSIRSVMGYALKSQFDRREWFRKWRPGRRPFWDTQPRPLLGLRLVELLAFLDRIGLHGRLLTKGVDVESLQRARAIRAAKRPQSPAEGRPSLPPGKRRCPPLNA